jgi:alpha-amylase/alpha-mannosidase (GH57 family)/PAS domain-containing protein
MEQKTETRSLIIHGHFYQPPRENPWTERIERQRSASPYHDWNERITSECYLPNTRSRRLDGFGRITRLVNNYEWISFNFGPTLLSWLEDKHPEVYGKILEADRASIGREGGHGNAIAQAYNHIIMPLANRRDQETQIRWGIYDFQRRFGREPEGIWLPETAVSDVTIEILLDFGLSFIVLSPHQAESVRPLHKKGKWIDVSNGSIPAGSPYRFRKPGSRKGGRYIDIFFYDAQLSHDVSFNHLLRNGDSLADAVIEGYPRSKSNLIVIATDGENYGHHEPFADMALAYLIDEGAARKNITLTNFGAYLAKHGPEHEVRLKKGRNGEGTSWSCIHGVDRWKEDCGCSTGSPAVWNQAWRTPLRTGLDSLRDSLALHFERECSGLLSDPWKSRNDYIEVIEDRTPEASAAFVASHAPRELDETERSRVLTLLESQRNALLMFTSCGWFFNDISGIETVQLLMYAARTIELAGEGALENKLVRRLEKARSNIEGIGTGADLYRDATRGTAVTAPALVAQHAIYTHLFGAGEAEEVFGRLFEPLDEQTEELDGGTVQIGHVLVTCPYTLKKQDFLYVLFIEDETGYRCFVGEPRDDGDFARLRTLYREAKERGGAQWLAGAVSKHLPGSQYKPIDLFPEDRERTLRALASRKLESLEERYRALYLETRDLIRMLNESSIDIASPLLVPAEAALTRMLLDEIEGWEHTLAPDGLSGIRNIITEASYYGVPIDKTTATDSFTELLVETILGLREPLDAKSIDTVIAFVSLVDEIEVAFHDGTVQNVLYPVLESTVLDPLERDGTADAWNVKERAAAQSMLRLAQRFNFNVDRWLSWPGIEENIRSGGEE